MEKPWGGCREANVDERVIVMGIVSDAASGK